MPRPAVRCCSWVIPWAGLLCVEYAGREDPPPIAGFIAASCTAIPRGLGLSAYRVLARGFDSLPDRGMWLTNRMLDRILPDETRDDFGAGGYALDAQDIALRSLSVLDLLAALHRIDVPLWFINGQFDQLRVNERLFMQVAQHAELIVVPRTTHHVTVMRPRRVQRRAEPRADRRSRTQTADWARVRLRIARVMSPPTIDSDAADGEHQREAADECDQPGADQRSEQLAEARRDVDEAQVAGVVLGVRQQVGAEREADRHVRAVADAEECGPDHRRLVRRDERDEDRGGALHDRRPDHDSDASAGAVRDRP